MSASSTGGLLDSLRGLFYVSTIFGVIPLSLRAFYKRRILQVSITGNVWVVCNIIVYTALYHVATTNYVKDHWGSQKTLTNAIGIFVTYMEPIMMSTDMVAGMFNQKRIIESFERLNRVDAKLAGEGIQINNRHLQHITLLLGLSMLFFEAVITVYSFVVFEEAVTFVSMIWFITTIPTALNSVCRIWFILLVHAVRQRFNAMNAHMSEIAQGLQHYKEQHGSERDKEMCDVPLDYLEKEIFTVYTQKKLQLAATPPKKKHLTTRVKKVEVKPYEAINSGKKPSPVPSRRNVVHPSAKQERPGAAQEFLPSDIRQRARIDQRMDSKLILICRTHDELCEIGKIINRMYSVQMLVAMAHGFVAITAQLYFLYCGLTGQEVPILFRSAQVLLLSLTYICYTALKCVVPIFVCWKTKTDSHRTGIEMHHLANVIDESHCYEVVNHLSLKLLNHHLNFSACGFFDLDMTTLYAITGAVTSYLIILIQFNLAAIQKSSGNTTSIANVTTTALAIIDEVTTALTTSKGPK